MELRPDAKEPDIPGWLLQSERTEGAKVGLAEGNEHGVSEGHGTWEQQREPVVNGKGTRGKLQRMTKV